VARRRDGHPGQHHGDHEPSGPSADAAVNGGDVLAVWRTQSTPRDIPAKPDLMTALPNPFGGDRRKFHASINNLFYFNELATLSGGICRICVKYLDTHPRPGQRRGLCRERAKWFIRFATSPSEPVNVLWPILRDTRFARPQDEVSFYIKDLANLQMHRSDASGKTS
jgi:hypothetical protein